jgi:hypothetical protein
MAIATAPRAGPVLEGDAVTHLVRNRGRTDRPASQHGHLKHRPPPAALAPREWGMFECSRTRLVRSECGRPRVAGRRSPGWGRRAAGYFECGRPGLVRFLAAF